MDPGNLLLCLWKRNRWITEPDAARKAFGDAALPRNHCSLRNFQVACNAYLSPHHDALAHPSASGNARLRHDHRIFSNDYVVRDLHEIIDLHAFLDPSPAKPRAVDGRVRADLNIVVDLNDAELLNLLLSPIERIVTFG